MVFGADLRFFLTSDQRLYRLNYFISMFAVYKWFNVAYPPH